MLAPPEVYDIPLRSLYSRNIANLMMAGRNISASYVAFTSARVMATCAVIGQAVGTAAAQCVESAHAAARPGARSPGRSRNYGRRCCATTRPSRACTNQDPLDLARTAKVTASAEAGAAKAALLLDGHLRDIPDKKGDPARSAPLGGPGLRGRPAWVELRWDQPQRIREVQITFDSGFKRQLTLSSQEAQNVNLLRAAQPETVKDYTVVARTADGNGTRPRHREEQFPAAQPPPLRARRNPIGAHRSASHQRRPAGANLRSPLLRVSRPDAFAPTPCAPRLILLPTGAV